MQPAAWVLVVWGGGVGWGPGQFRTTGSLETGIIKTLMHAAAVLDSYSILVYQIILLIIRAWILQYTGDRTLVNFVCRG